MRPKEFLARVIDLFAFDMGGLSSGWKDIRPKTFSAAALCIGFQPNPPASMLVNGYLFKLETEQALGHTVIRATMTGDNCSLGGSICFTFQEYDSHQTMEDTPEHEHIFESWQVPMHMKNDVDEIVSMLTFLTLRTNYSIRHKSHA